MLNSAVLASFTDMLAVVVSAWLLVYLLHSTLLIGLAWGVTRLIRSKYLCETIWRAALFGAVLTSGFHAAGLGGYSLHSFGGKVRKLAGYAERVPAESLPSQSSALAQQASAGTGPITESVEVEHARLSGKVDGHKSIGKPAIAYPQTVSRFLPLSLNWPYLILGVWVTGVMITAGRVLRKHGFIKAQLCDRSSLNDRTLRSSLCTLGRKTGINKPIELTVSQSLVSPVAFKAEICLPEVAVSDLSHEQQVGILAHELAHIRRQDPTWLWLYSSVSCLFFFQPLNSLAISRLHSISEFLCDDLAVQNTGLSKVLAQSLTAVAGWIKVGPRTKLVAGIAGSESALVQRIRRLLDYESSHESRPAKVSHLLTAMALFAFPVVALPNLSLEWKSLFQDRAGKVESFAHYGKMTGFTEDIYDDGRLEIAMRWKGGRRIELRAKGVVELAEALTSVRLERGAYFNLREWGTGEDFQLKIRNDSVGEQTIEFDINGQEHAFDQEGRTWLAKVMQPMVRESSYFAKQHAHRIMEEDGPEALLDEIAESRFSSYSKLIYLRYLFENPELEHAVRVRALRIAGEEIKASVELAQLLSEVYRSTGFDTQTYEAFYEAASAISGSVELGHLLSETALTLPNEDGVHRAYLTAASLIVSEVELSLALHALMERAHLSKENVRFLLEICGNIRSDIELASVLIQVIDSMPLDPELATAVWDVGKRIRSQAERQMIEHALQRYRVF